MKRLHYMSLSYQHKGDVRVSMDNWDELEII